MRARVPGCRGAKVPGCSGAEVHWQAGRKSAHWMVLIPDTLHGKAHDALLLGGE